MEILNSNNIYTLQEFLEFENSTDEILEFISGYIYNKSFTSLNHNTIVNAMSRKVSEYLDDKPCRVFTEQIEVILGENRVKPDVFVVCKGKDNKYEKVGQSLVSIPIVIFEIVSASNAELDTIIKMNLYAKHGIEEYNLVYQEGTIIQYKLNEHGSYYLNKAYEKNDIYKSITLDNFKMEIKEIFKDVE
ncbi:Uma2 family endonuclease [uncultured Clostridium sp.]|uniref:Uma2 family endonuclease n=1 Tax=uncultured Clostridium sp. TaxID=59620 RepID=UPI002617617E|nr:Uma2 family endonuclease [uncultured Clostridium sp.]